MTLLLLKVVLNKYYDEVVGHVGGIGNIIPEVVACVELAEILHNSGATLIHCHDVIADELLKLLAEKV